MARRKNHSKENSPKLKNRALSAPESPLQLLGIDCIALDKVVRLGVQLGRFLGVFPKMMYLILIWSNSSRKTRIQLA